MGLNLTTYTRASSRRDSPDEGIPVPDLASLLSAPSPMVVDGAMGTQLQLAGLDDGGAPELWNAERPDDVEAILAAYVDAGSQAITTNTFGGTRPRLAMHGLEERVRELNVAAVQIARRAADRGDGVLVLGGLGPIGELLEPLGTMTPDEATAHFAAQVAALVEGGVDAILIETMSDLGEVEAAVRAVRQEAPDLPIMVTLSFDTNLRTMMGVTPAAAVSTLSNLEVDVVGANCGRGMDEARTIAAQLAAARTGSIRLMMSPNAGLPQLIDGEFRYTGTPDEMAEFAVEMRDLGIDVIGACCGSTPEHIRAIRQALAG